MAMCKMRYKSFYLDSAKSKNVWKDLSPLHFRVVDNYSGGCNGSCVHQTNAEYEICMHPLLLRLFLSTRL